MCAQAGVVQLVEHLLAKEKVTSSSLVARSDEMAGSVAASTAAARALSAALFGDVAKW